MTQTIPVTVASTAITMQMTAVAPPEEVQQGGAQEAPQQQQQQQQTPSATTQRASAPTLRIRLDVQEAVAEIVHPRAVAALNNLERPKEPGAAQSREDADRQKFRRDIDPVTPPAGWVFDDEPIRTEPDGTRVLETTVIVGGKRGTIERAYNPTTKTFEMRNAFLEELPRWIDEGTPLVDGRGTPTVTYLSIRQMKILGGNYAGLEKVKMSTIQNLKAIIQLHVLRARGIDVNDAVLQTHSVEYAETAIIQSGHSVVGAEVTGNIWTNRKLDFLMKWFERNDPTLAAKHDELIRKHGAGIVTRDTEVWMNYDIILEVAPFAAIPSTTGRRVHEDHRRHAASDPSRGVRLAAD